jgi:RNA polymerase sigma factor (TIGR02999 family)
MVPMSDVSHILCAMEQGDPHAAQQLLPLVYAELRQLAAQRLAQEKPGHTLQATALVHEAYLRLVASPGAERCWDSRRHFFAAAAEAMRRILIESARRKRRQKHGGGRQRQELPADLAAGPAPDDDLIALDGALNRFAEKYPLQARLVELRYFAGLTGDEAASLLDISPSTADRHWVFARAWLRRELRRGENSEES